MIETVRLHVKYHRIYVHATRQQHASIGTVFIQGPAQYCMYIVNYDAVIESSVDSMFAYV